MYEFGAGEVKLDFNKIFAVQIKWLSTFTFLTSQLLPPKKDLVLWPHKGRKPARHKIRSTRIRPGPFVNH